MDGKWRILIAEDHALFRAGLRALLEQDGDIEIVGEADNGRDAVRAAGALAPNLVLMDLSMPGMNGIEAIRQIKQRYPDIHALVLTMHGNESYIQESLQAGADGYILKNASHDELRLALHTVLNGESYWSPAVVRRVARCTDCEQAVHAARSWDVLTRRERQVLKLVAEGHPNRYIADYLCLSVKTVEKHRSNLMKKLDLHNASTLTAYAIENGLRSFFTEGPDGLRVMPRH